MKRISFIFLIIILLLSGCASHNTEENNKIIDNIISYDNNYSYDFLNYISNNYGMSVIKEIKDSYASNNYDDKLWHSITGKSIKVLRDNYNKEYEKIDNVKVLDKKDKVTLSFVGDISLADNFDIMPYYDKRGEGVYGILSKEVVDIMNNADIMVANNEFTISDRGSPLNKQYTFRASPNRLNIYKEMGVDLVSIANNHIYDYGEEAFQDSLKYLKEYDIPYVGAGTNIEEAKRAFYYIAGGYKISFISASRAEKNIVTPGATSTSSGVFRCYDNELLINTIKEEKEKSDYVILLIHWGKEDSHELEEVMLKTSKEYVDAGADLVVGSHAHLLQGMEFYKDKLIAYNLGDFIFNRETKDTGILNVNILNDGSMTYDFIPCIQKDYKTSILSDNDRLRVLNNMNNYSINAIFNTDGSISRH